MQIQQIQDEAKFQQEFSERKAFIEKTITEQGKMTEQLQAKLNEAETIAQLEDLYLPYKPKRKTKAQTAREWAGAAGFIDTGAGPHITVD